MKHLTKISILCIGLLIVTFACQKEEITTQHQSVNESISYKTLSLDDIEKLKPVVNNIKQIPQKTPIGSFAREFSFLSLDSLDTESIIEYTDQTGYSTYTFKVNGFENSANFENLHLLETDEGFIGYILSYEPDLQWYSQQNQVSPEGDFIIDFSNFQGHITKFSLEREIIWTTKGEYETRQMEGRAGGFIEVCVFSIVATCDYGGQDHPWGANCTGNKSFDTVETCQTVWSSGGATSGDGNTNNSNDNGGNNSGNNDDCDTNGTSIIDDLPLSGINGGCAPNNGTGVDSGSEMFAFSHQLNQILGDDDSFEFDDNISTTNAINFGSIALFEEYINYVDNQEAINIGSTESMAENNDTYTRGMSFDIDPVMNTNIRVDVQQELIEGEPISIVDVTSYLQGVTTFREWTQVGNFDSFTLGNKRVVKLKGQLKIGVVIEGYGLYYTQTYHIRLEFDLTTGELLNGWITLIE